MAVKAGYLILGGVGLVFFWSGVRGKSVTNVVRDLIGGKNPANEKETQGIAGVLPTPAPGQGQGLTSLGGAGVGSGGSGSGSAIAADALRYVGHKYVFGGPSNPNGGWDCSSFASYVLGHDIGIAIPGGSWRTVTNNGASHGPVAANYLMWSGATTIPRAQVGAGDLLCWQTHVGFAANSNQMISAYDTARGTVVTGIDGAGPTGEVLVCRRVNGF